MARRLKVKQVQLLAEILGNIGVAWFAGGIIGPIFLAPIRISQLWYTFTVGGVMAAAFIWIALLIIKKRG